MISFINSSYRITFKEGLQGIAHNKEIRNEILRSISFKSHIKFYLS